MSAQRYISFIVLKQFGKKLGHLGFLLQENAAYTLLRALKKSEDSSLTFSCEQAAGLKVQSSSVLFSTTMIFQISLHAAVFVKQLCKSCRASRACQYSGNSTLKFTLDSAYYQMQEEIL